MIFVQCKEKRITLLIDKYIFDKKRTNRAKKCVFRKCFFKITIPKWCHWGNCMSKDKKGYTENV